MATLHATFHKKCIPVTKCHTLMSMPNNIEFLVQHNGVLKQYNDSNLNLLNTRYLQIHSH
jgi:hypothetical protein